MVKHTERPVKLWCWDKGWKKLLTDVVYEYFHPSEFSGGPNDKLNWNCNVGRLKTLEAVRAWSKRHQENPCICKECAVRLGLEW